MKSVDESRLDMRRLGVKVISGIIEIRRHWLIQAELLHGSRLLRLRYSFCTNETAGQGLEPIWGDAGATIENEKGGDLRQAARTNN